MLENQWTVEEVKKLTPFQTRQELIKLELPVFASKTQNQLRLLDYVKTGRRFSKEDLSGMSDVDIEKQCAFYSLPIEERDHNIEYLTEKLKSLSKVKVVVGKGIISTPSRKSKVKPNKPVLAMRSESDEEEVPKLDDNDKDEEYKSPRAISKRSSLVDIVLPKKRVSAVKKSPVSVKKSPVSEETPKRISAGSPMIVIGKRASSFRKSKPKKAKMQLIVRKPKSTGDEMDIQTDFDSIQPIDASSKPDTLDGVLGLKSNSASPAKKPSNPVNEQTVEDIIAQHLKSNIANPSLHSDKAVEEYSSSAKYGLFESISKEDASNLTKKKKKKIISPTTSPAKHVDDIDLTSGLSISRKKYKSKIMSSQSEDLELSTESPEKSTPSSESSKEADVVNESPKKTAKSPKKAVSTIKSPEKVTKQSPKKQSPLKSPVKETDPVVQSLEEDIPAKSPIKDSPKKKSPMKETIVQETEKIQRRSPRKEVVIDEQEKSPVKTQTVETTEVEIVETVELSKKEMKLKKTQEQTEKGKKWIVEDAKNTKELGSNSSGQRENCSNQ